MQPSEAAADDGEDADTSLESETAATELFSPAKTALVDEEIGIELECASHAMSIGLS